MSPELMSVCALNSNLLLCPSLPGFIYEIDWQALVSAGPMELDPQTVLFVDKETEVPRGQRVSTSWQSPWDWNPEILT